MRELTLLGRRFY